MKTRQQLINQRNRIGEMIIKGRKSIPAADTERLMKVNSIYFDLLDRIQ